MRASKMVWDFTCHEGRHCLRIFIRYLAKQGDGVPRPHRIGAPSCIEHTVHHSAVQVPCPAPARTAAQ